MTLHYAVKNGNSIPVQAPRFAENSVNPYYCNDHQTIAVYCRATPEIIDKYLAPTPFKSVSDVFMIMFSDCTNHDGIEGAYQGVSFVFPVKHRDVIGGYHMFTYTDNTDIVLRNREVFGYPDKLASINILEENDKITCTCHIQKTGVSNGSKLIHLELDKSKPLGNSLDVPNMTPDIILKTMGRPEGPGILYELALSRDTSPDFTLKNKIEAQATVKLYENSENPLNEFSPIEVLGGVYTVGDFASTNENGWAKILEEVIPLEDYFKS
ncbi:acetoacetate decarboxylase family protein [Desulforhopalus singaporensis]|uniref:Acetoacetate decarboxylase n=1 Tax=Desulforhopalus singaporensis TaxID=91360 RepID=A0A1H0V8U9_9BACT|nr:acetoacetate decarboxylase family protein [Desulforhopalus singaporensis]SDP74817.1 Acetoacetate decarboxylase [Desulforhopalus singaporensis]